MYSSSHGDNVNTRIEISIRPHNVPKLKGLKLKNVDEIPNILSGLKIYQPSLHHALEGEQVKLVKNFGISALRRKYGAQNTERVKLSTLLDNHEIDVDTESLNQVMIKLLQGERSRLLGFNKKDNSS
jgi:hypothetical protein